MVHFGEFLKTWSLRSNSVTRQVSFNRTKIGGKCQNSNTTFWVKGLKVENGGKIQNGWLTLLHWLHYGFHYAIGVPTFFAVGCSRVILQLEGLILTYPFGHELCKEEHRNDSSPLSSSWFSISNWAIIYLLSFSRNQDLQPSCLNIK